MGWSGEGNDQPMNGDGLSCLGEWQEIARRLLRVMLGRADIVAHDFGGKLRHCAELPPIVFRRLLPEPCVGTPHLLGGLAARRCIRPKSSFTRQVTKFCHSWPNNTAASCVCLLAWMPSARAGAKKGRANT